MDSSPHNPTPTIGLAGVQLLLRSAVTLDSKLSVASENTNVLRSLLLLQPGVRPGAHSTTPTAGWVFETRLKLLPVI